MSLEISHEGRAVETGSERIGNPADEIRESWLPELKSSIPIYHFRETPQCESRTWDDIPKTRNPETGETEIHLKSGKDSDVLNQVPCPPNVQIHIDDKQGENYTIVTTDEKGRIVSVERPQLEIVDPSDRQRDPVQTGRTFELKDGRSDSEGERMDDGGHVVADEFGGSSEQTNLVPQDSEVNRHGAWRDMEKQIEGELKKEPPSQVTNFKVDIAYEGESSRPVAFEVSYEVNGEPVQFVIINERIEGDVRNAA